MLYQIARLVSQQHWLRFGLRNRFARFCCPVRDRRKRAFSVDFQGIKYRGDLSSFIDWHVFFYGAYEFQELQYLHSLARKLHPLTFVDIGANVGQHSLYLRTVCDTVHAFEPSPIIYEKFCGHIEYNNIENIHVHNIGLGKQDEILTYFVGNAANDGIGTFVSSRNAHGQQLQLQIRKADACLQELQLDNLRLIKIDVEGFEKRVLEGLQQTLRAVRPVVFMEFSSDTREDLGSMQALEQLLPEDYRLREVRSCQPVFGVFNKRKISLAPFDFEKADGNVLIYPAELSELVECY